MKKDLLYPYLIECCKYTSDKFWKGVFEDLAYGISPYGTYIHKDMLTCNYKDKGFVYKLQKKDSKELFDDIVSLFKNKLELVSQDEIIQKKQSVAKNISYDDWSNIKKKNLKEILIERFAIAMCKEHHLSITETRYLVSVIFLSFIFKVLTSSDITINNGIIESVDGISFENGKVIVEKNIYGQQINMSPDIVMDKMYMSDEWDKYLSCLRKINV